LAKRQPGGGQPVDDPDFIARDHHEGAFADTLSFWRE
jgi:hypothetical protein